jgi:teichuronic acid biosynthesis glycosyltransferase TuaC
MRLKVAVVTPIFPIPGQPYRGRATYEMLRALTSRAEVEVICPFTSYPKWFRPRFDYRRPDLSYSPADIPSRYFEYPALPGLTRYINGLTCANYLAPYLRDFMPDVVLNFWLYPEGYAAVEAARRLGIPAIVGAIGSDLNSIADPVSGCLTRLAMSRAELVVTKSEHLRQQAIRMGINAGKVRTVSNGCDSSIFHLADRSAARKLLGIEEQVDLVLFVGRLDPTKGIVELLNAFTLLATDYPKLHLVYVGDGPGNKLLRHITSEARLNKRVLLVDPCSSKEVAQWLIAANVLALPSYAEGCPSVIVEALSCGRPVIATNVGGIPELVNEECSILVGPRDVQELASAIAIAMRRNWDERLISELFRRSWEQVADEIFSACDLAVHQYRSAHQPLVKPSAATSR